MVEALQRGTELDFSITEHIVGRERGERVS